MYKFIFFIMSLLLFLPCFALPTPPPPDFDSVLVDNQASIFDTISYVSGVLILKLEEGYPIDSVLQDASSFTNCELDTVLALEDWYLIQVSPEQDLDTLINEFESLEGVEVAHPDYLYTAQSHYPPNDDYYDDEWQWNMYSIGMDNVWDNFPKFYELGEYCDACKPVRICILDSGIDKDHPEIHNIVSSACCDDYVHCDIYKFPWFFMREELLYVEARGGDIMVPDDDPHDEFGHGTHLTGVITAITNNDIGVAGINCAIEILPIRIFGSGYDFTSSVYYLIHDDLFLGWAISVADKCHRCNVILIGGSFWGDILWPEGEAYIHSLIKNQPGIIFVAPSGNWGDTDSTYPASFDEVFAVGAVNSDDRRSDFSSYGSWIDFAAPGGNYGRSLRKGTDIVSTMPTYDHFYNDNISGDTRNYFLMEGTSIAAAHVAGLVSLILSWNNKLSRNEVKWVISSTCSKVGGYDYDEETGKSLELGYGKINVFAALRLLTDLRDRVNGYDNHLLNEINNETSVRLDIPHWARTWGYNTDSLVYFFPWVEASYTNRQECIGWEPEERDQPWLRLGFFQDIAPFIFQDIYINDEFVYRVFLREGRHRQIELEIPLGCLADNKIYVKIKPEPSSDYAVLAEIEVFYPESRDYPPVTCPHIYVYDGYSLYLDNNLLPQIGLIDSTDVYDILYVSTPPIADSGLYFLRLGELSSDYSYIDYARLVAIDRPEGFLSAVDNNNEFYIYNPEDAIFPVAAYAYDTINILDLIVEDDGDFYESKDPGGCISIII